MEGMSNPGFGLGENVSEARARQFDRSQDGRFHFMVQILTLRYSVRRHFIRCAVAASNPPYAASSGKTMTIKAHLAELERRHQGLENEIVDALAHGSTDALKVTELKRQK